MEPGTTGTDRNNLQALAAFMGIACIGFLIASLVFVRTRFTVHDGDHEINSWDRLR